MITKVENKYYNSENIPIPGATTIMNIVGYIKKPPDLKHIVEASEIGTAVHKDIEDFINNGMFSSPKSFKYSEEVEYVESVLEQLKLEPVEAEKVVDNNEIYCGTIDLVATNEDGELVLCDWKNCSSFKESHFVQLELYRMCFDEKAHCYVVNTKLKETKKSELRHLEIAMQILEAYKAGKQVELTPEILESLEIDFLEAERFLEESTSILKSMITDDNTKAVGKHLTLSANKNGVVTIRRNK